MPVCERHCDHCYPEALHRCAGPKGHGGYCSCEPQAGDETPGGAMTPERLLQIEYRAKDGIVSRYDVADLIAAYREALAEVERLHRDVAAARGGDYEAVSRRTSELTVEASRLRTEAARIEAEVVEWTTRAEKAEAQVAAVLALHTQSRWKSSGAAYDRCHCGGAWPCPTVTAIEGAS